MFHKHAINHVQVGEKTWGFHYHQKYNNLVVFWSEVPHTLLLIWSLTVPLIWSEDGNSESVPVGGSGNTVNLSYFAVELWREKCHSFVFHVRGFMELLRATCSILHVCHCSSHICFNYSPFIAKLSHTVHFHKDCFIASAPSDINLCFNSWICWNYSSN